MLLVTYQSLLLVIPNASLLFTPALQSAWYRPLLLVEPQAGAPLLSVAGVRGILSPT